MGLRLITKWIEEEKKDVATLNKYLANNLDDPKVKAFIAAREKHVDAINKNIEEMGKDRIEYHE